MHPDVDIPLIAFVASDDGADDEIPRRQPGPVHRLGKDP